MRDLVFMALHRLIASFFVVAGTNICRRCVQFCVEPAIMLAQPVCSYAVVEDRSFCSLCGLVASCVHCHVRAFRLSFCSS